MRLTPAEIVRAKSDAELLLWAVAYADLPAGLRIIDIGRASIKGVAVGSGHGLAKAHRLRPGMIAVGVALEALADDVISLGFCSDDAAFAIESVAAHELAHAIVAPIDGERSPACKQALRDLPALVAAMSPLLGEPDKEARDHDGRWAGALVAIVRRCGAVRPLQRVAWAACVKADLRRYGIDADAVAEALGDIPDEVSLRELLAEGGPVADRVARAVPSLGERVAVIADFQFAPSGPGHVARVVGGAVSRDEVPLMLVELLNVVQGRQVARAAGIEELARRLAAGEKAQADEVEAVLTRTGCTVDDLRERVACLERRAEQHRAIAAGEKAEKRLAKIRAEINDARIVAVEAIEKADAIAQRHWGDTIALEQTAREAFRAKELLLAPVNLTVQQREQLAQAKQAYDDAERALSESQASMPAIRARITKLEADTAEDEKDCRLHPENGDLRERLNRHKLAAETKRRELKEAESGLPGLQAAFDKARESLRTIEAELMR